MNTCIKSTEGEGEVPIAVWITSCQNALEWLCDVSNGGIKLLLKDANSSETLQLSMLLKYDFKEGMQISLNFLLKNQQCQHLLSQGRNQATNLYEIICGIMKSLLFLYQEL